jgi:CelD/BcsL family acetyltransferase involved in cellulose biosynthesis
MEFTVIAEREAGALEKFRPQWEALAAAALEPNPFFEHWLLLPALRAFGARHDVRIVCVWRGAELCGLFPFQLASRYKGLPIRALDSWRNPHGLLGTPLIARDRGRECFSALFRWLRGQRIATLVQFSYVPAGGPVHQALIDALNTGRHASRLADIYSRGLLCRDENADAYINSALSVQSRQKLRRSEKRLHEQGRVTHRVLKPGDDVQVWIDDFLRVEASGWKGARGSALSCTETNRRFINEAFTTAFKRGRLVMVGIDVGGLPIARYSGFVAGEGSFAFKTAYDENFRRFAPGLLAELDMIRAFHALPGVRWMDSITGPSNSTIDRLWKHRLLVQQLAVAVGARGEFAVLVLLPVLQWAKRSLWRLASVLPGRPWAENPVPKSRLAPPAASQRASFGRSIALALGPIIRLLTSFFARKTG